MVQFLIITLLQNICGCDYYVHHPFTLEDIYIYIYIYIYIVTICIVLHYLFVVLY